MARLRGAARGAAPDRREGLLLPPGSPGAGRSSLPLYSLWNSLLSFLNSSFNCFLLLCACAAPAAARADGPDAAGRANQDVPGAQQDPLQGRQRRAQGNSVAFLFSDFNLVPGPDLLTVRLLPPCVSAPVLQAETETDEMYAQITLQPEPDVSTDTEWTDWTTIIYLLLVFLFGLFSALQMSFLLSLPNSTHLYLPFWMGSPQF